MIAVWFRANDASVDGRLALALESANLKLEAQNCILRPTLRLENIELVNIQYVSSSVRRTSARGNKQCSRQDEA